MMGARTRTMAMKETRSDRTHFEGRDKGSEAMRKRGAKRLRFGGLSLICEDAGGVGEQLGSFVETRTHF